MRALVLMFIMLMSVVMSAGAQPTLLGGSQVREVLSGRTVYLKGGWGIELPVAYRADGTMSGRLKAYAAALAGARSRFDRGRWWIAQDQLCQRWRNWLNGRAFCYRLARHGSTVYWRDNVGRSGTARLGR